MNKETISMRQAICIVVMFICGSSVIMGISSEAGQDFWISLLMAAAFAFPILMMYARIIRLFPEKDFFAVTEELFGKVIGKIITALFVWYAIHLAALVLRNFSEFIQIVTMPETPQLAIMITMMLVVAYMVKSGIETMGKWSVFMLPFILLVVLMTIVFALNKIDFTNLLPFMEHDFKTVADGSFQLVAFPYAETVLFLCVAGAVRKKDSPYKIYLTAAIVGTVILLLIILRNLLMLGAAMVDTEYFPSYTAVRIIEVGNYLSRIEGSIAMNFILVGIIKIGVSLLAASRGMAKLFDIGDYRQIVLPVSLLVIALCAVVYRNVMEMFGFIRYYRYYAIPFQIILPLMIWLAAEIKARRRKSSAQKRTAS